MKKRICIISMAIAFCLTLSAGVWAEDKQMPFTDIQKDSWYNFYVQDLYNNNIINGTTETTFSPEKMVTRAEFAKMLAIPAGIDEADYQGLDNFTDVSKSAWYATYVEWAKEAGIIKGKGNALFAPNDLISKEEAATMIHRMARNIAKRDIIANCEKITFNDEVQIANWAKEAVSTLQAGGVIKGSDGYFFPQEGTTRAEIATMLSTYLLMDYQTGEVEYFNEHLPELEAEIKENEKYLESLPEPEEDSFTLPDNSSSGTASLSGFQSKGGFQFLDGDILYDTEAGYGLTGHIAMVCGNRFFEIMPNTNKTTNSPALVALEPDNVWGTWSNRYNW